MRVVLCRSDPLVALRDDPAFDLHEIDPHLTRVDLTVSRLLPRVLILSDAEPEAISAIVRSIRRPPGLVVMACEPRVPYGMGLLAGGVSCVAIGAPARALRASVALAAQGGCMFVSADGDQVARNSRADAPLLTSRETQVLEGLSRRRSYGQIAHESNASYVAIAKAAARLACKMKATTARELVGMPLPALSVGR